MKCIICGKDLSGIRRKFCSDSHRRFYHTREEKKRYLSSKKRLPKRNCLLCGNSFSPRGEAHKCCNNVCRQLFERKKKREISKKNKLLREQKKQVKLQFWKKLSNKNEPKKNEPKKNNKRKNVIKTFPFPINNSCFKAEIEEFKKKGGVIKKLPPQLNGKIPGVNVSNLSGWSIETLIGFGYEVRLMEELSTTSEVIDAN